MNTPIFIQKIYNRITHAKFFYVTLDVCPDFTTGQSEMCSYTIRATNEEVATEKAIKKAMADWTVDREAVYVVECVETKSQELIYDIDR